MKLALLFGLLLPLGLAGCAAEADTSEPQEAVTPPTMNVEELLAYAQPGENADVTLLNLWATW